MYPLNSFCAGGLVESNAKPLGSIERSCGLSYALAMDSSLPACRPVPIMQERLTWLMFLCTILPWGAHHPDFLTKH